jgi:hypothetical protein
VTLLTFEAALSYLKEGGKVARDYWKDSSNPKYIFVDYGNVGIKIQSVSKLGEQRGFGLYENDILANDWVFVLEDEEPKT